MTSTLNNKYGETDLMIYYDDINRKYTKDSLLSSLYRFVYFSDEVIKKSNSDNEIVDDELNPGLFRKNLNGWNVYNACKWLHSHSHYASQHMCAKYVRMAIEAGGISTAGRPTWAWKYIDFLPRIGFRFIGKVNRKDMNMFRAEPGDIAVYQKNGNPSVPGHICMWTGVMWESDFKQKNMIVYSGTQSAYLFRFES